MIVKITPKGPESVKVSRPAAAAEARHAVPAQPAASGPAESLVQLSQLATGQPGAGEVPFNAEQVERIKQAIRNGEFTVNAEAVADRLLEIERALAHKA
ncbi:MAG: flagellar biosynthesis anti-sigma factor FlgM [Pigmentiphaga sp.]|nr:flagellar biosynthesis anti-sigma factor FlgM [Pigmentiphaga sp.]